MKPALTNEPLVPVKKQPQPNLSLHSFKISFNSHLRRDSPTLSLPLGFLQAPSTFLTSVSCATWVTRIHHPSFAHTNKSLRAARITWFGQKIRLRGVKFRRSISCIACDYIRRIRSRVTIIWLRRWRTVLVSEDLKAIVSWKQLWQDGRQQKNSY